MIDMRSAIKAAIEPKSDQLNADSLFAGPITIRIRDVKLTRGEQPVSIFYDGDDGKPWKPCKSMFRLLVFVWCKKDDPDTKDFIGKSLVLKRDPDVIYGGAPVGGIRVTHMSGIREPVKVYLTASKTKRVPYTVEPLIVAEQPQQQPAQKQPSPNVEYEARLAAERGMDELKLFWDQLIKPQQKALSPHLAAL